MTAATDDKMPPGIPYIIANEFAERFCFYGINAILAVYMTQHLHFGEAKATEWQSHTVRGFIAGTLKKAGIVAESFKRENGDRAYRIA